MLQSPQCLVPVLGRSFGALTRVLFAAAVSAAAARDSLPVGGNSDEVWTRVACLPAEAPPEARYRIVQRLDSGAGDAEDLLEVGRGSQAAKGEVRTDAGARRDEAPAWRIDYDFAGREGIEAVHLLLRRKAVIPGPGLGIGFWARLGGEPVILRARFVDTGGETHQIDLKTDSRKDWQYVAGQFDERGISWGGDGNGRKDYPCRLTALFIDRPRRGYAGRGTSWIAAPALVSPRPERHTLEVRLRRPPFGLLYAPGSLFELAARGEGDRLAWRIVDFQGAVCARGEGAKGETTVAWRVPGPGHYGCILEMNTDGRVVEAETCAFAVLEGGVERHRSDFVGVCSHFGQQRYPLESMELMAAYGIHQFRDEISWQSFERRKGERVMPVSADAYLDRAARLGMRPLIILDYGNRHYDGGGYPNSEEAVAGFGAYALELLRQARGRIAHVEVWNEWVGGCGMKGKPGVHDGASYGRLLRPTHAAIKRAYPEMTVVGIGGEDGSERLPRILDAIGTAGPDSMDAWSIHPYRYPRTPEETDLVGEVAGDLEAVRRLGVRSGVWITETGYPTHRAARGCTEEDQAALLVRTYALLQAMGGVEKVFWYDFKDDGLARDYNEDNFGLVRHERFLCAPKPGVVALSVYIRMTGGAVSAAPCPVPDGRLRAVRFRRASGDEVIAVWSTEGSVELRHGGELTRVVGITGETRSREAPLVATAAPLYLAGRRLELRR